MWNNTTQRVVQVTKSMSFETVQCQLFLFSHNIQTERVNIFRIFFPLHDAVKIKLTTRSLNFLE